MGCTSSTATALNPQPTLPLLHPQPTLPLLHPQPTLLLLHPQPTLLRQLPAAPFPAAAAPSYATAAHFPAATAAVQISELDHQPLHKANSQQEMGAHKAAGQQEMAMHKAVSATNLLGVLDSDLSSPASGGHHESASLCRSASTEGFF